MSTYRTGRAVLWLTGISVALAAQPPAPLQTRLTRWLDEAQPALITLRRDLHQHPEAAGEEIRTASVIAEALRAAGLEVRTEVGGHGVIGIVRGGRPGSIVGYRADMDAVRTVEPDPVSFRSTTPGLRHSCGHDVHMAIAIGLARAFSRYRSELPGTVVFVFQPAEETATGANAILASGVLDSLGVTAMFGLHTAPLPVGDMATVAGDMMSGHDAVDIELSGRGDLEAATTWVRDRLLALGTVPESDLFSPMPPDMALVQRPTVSDSAGLRRLRTTILTTSPRRPRLQRGVRALSDSSPPNVTIRSRYTPLVIPGVFNDAMLTTRAREVALRTLGTAHVLSVPTVIPAFSEDFGAYQRRMPGVFFFLGVSNPAAGTVGMPHTADYVADERAIAVGTRVMAAVLLDRLDRR